MGCDSNCQDGCRTWGTCNQCDDPKCSVCDSYYNTCTPDLTSPCNTGFHYSNKKCCDLKCLNCYGPGHYRCLSCTPSYYHLGNFCLTSCPTFSTLQNQNECEIPDPLAIDLTFKSLTTTLLDTQHNFPFKSGASSQFWPHNDDSHPIPAYSRGYYFKSSSFIKSDPISLSHNMSLIFFINIKNYGKLLQKTDFYIELNIDSKFHFKTSQYSMGSIELDIWQVVLFKMYFGLCPEDRWHSGWVPD